MFIFLLTGRISEIANPARHDLTLLFKYVCVHMQQNKEAEEEEKRKKEEHERKLKEAALARTAFEVAGHISAQVNVKEENLETNTSMLDTSYDQSIRNDSAGRSASATLNIVFRSSKRAAVHMTDDSAEPEFHRKTFTSSLDKDSLTHHQFQTLASAPDLHLHTPTSLHWLPPSHHLRRFKASSNHSYSNAEPRLSPNRALREIHLRKRSHSSELSSPIRQRRPWKLRRSSRSRRIYGRSTTSNRAL